MQACGQTSEQLPHCMQFSAIHSGTLTAMPRFSNLVVPVGTMPRGEAHHGQLIALLLQDGLDDVLEVLGGCNFNWLQRRWWRRPMRRAP